MEGLIVRTADRRGVLMTTALCGLVLVGACQGAAKVGPRSDTASTPPTAATTSTAATTDASQSEDTPSTSSVGSSTRSTGADSSVPDTGTPPSPLCEETPSRVRCLHETLELVVDGTPRRVLWQVPQGSPPPEGWPVAFGFHGSYVPAADFWEADAPDLLGLWHQAHTTRLLLEAGYAVLTPEAWPEAQYFWDTNVFPFSVSWETSPDHALVLALFDGIDRGDFGPLDGRRVHAFGYSSGGYMSSRMTLAYRDRVRSIALVAGSYATCAGLLCAVPALPADHAPTLLFHGGLDPIVPAWTSAIYEDALRANGTPTERIVRPALGHVWFEGTGETLLTWFEDHP